MSSEPQITVFGLAVGAALVYPATREMLQHADAVPGPALLIGGIFSALGIFIGSLLAMEPDSLVFKGLFLGFFGAVTLAFFAAMQIGALHSPGWIRLTLCELDAGLQLLAFGSVLYLAFRENRRHKASTSKTPDHAA
jgi:hypothetical protein